MEVTKKDVIEATVDSKGRITIPSEKRKEHRIEPGDDVEVAYLGKH